MIGVELDPHCHLTDEALRARRRHRAVQGVSAHGFRRARRGDGRPRAAHHPPRDQAGEIRVRLPHDRELPDLDPADARPGRQDHGAGRQGPRALGLDRPLLPLWRRAGMRRAHPGADRRRQAAWRQARRTDRPRADRVARTGGAAGILGRRRDRCRAGACRRPDRDRRHHRQCRRRRALRQHHLPAPPDRARRCRARRSRRSGTRSRCGSRSTPAKARELPFRFGGKTAKASGPPVDAEVEVIRCVPNAHPDRSAGAIVPLGDAARSAWAASRRC